MSALHGIRDIVTLDGPTFFRLAYRLPAYEGASRVDLEGWLEEVNAEPVSTKTDSEIRAELYENGSKSPYEEEDVVQPDPSRVATLEELQLAGPPMPGLMQNAPIFEVVRSTD